MNPVQVRTPAPPGTAADRRLPCLRAKILHRRGAVDAAFTATCEGATVRNGFYGEGIVDAYPRGDRSELTGELYGRALRR